MSPTVRFFAWMLVLGASMCLPSSVPAADDLPASTREWVPPTASDWMCLGNRLESAVRQARSESKKVSAGEFWAPLVAVDRTDGTLYAFPQGGPLWVSHDRGQTFEWLNRAYDERDPGLPEIKTDPLLANLRHDQRYVAVLKKMQLPA